jgi:hypothetical protein
MIAFKTQYLCPEWPPCPTKRVLLKLLRFNSMLARMRKRGHLQNSLSKAFEPAISEFFFLSSLTHIFALTCFNYIISH